MMHSTPEQWADKLRAAAIPHEVELITTLITSLSEKSANNASIVVACAALIGESVAHAGAPISAGIRAGAGALIDGFAMQHAVGVCDD